MRQPISGMGFRPHVRFCATAAAGAAIASAATAVTSQVMNSCLLDWEFSGTRRSGPCISSRTAGSPGAPSLPRLPRRSAAPRRCCRSASGTPPASARPSARATLFERLGDLICWANGRLAWRIEPQMRSRALAHPHREPLLALGAHGLKSRPLSCVVCASCVRSLAGALCSAP